MHGVIRTFAHLLFISLSLSIGGISHAADPSAEQLDKIKREMRDISQDSKKLTHKKHELQEKLAKQENDLLDLTNRIQSSELNREHLNKKLQELETKQQALSIEFDSRKQEIEKLIFAMIRLGNVPTEVMMLQPDGILAAAQGSMVMAGILPNIEEDIKKLNNDLEALSLLKQDIEQQQTAMRSVKDALKDDHKKLSRLIERRKTDLYNTNKDLSRHQVKLSKLSREAKSVEELVQKIEQLKNIPRPVSAPRHKIKKPEPPKVHAVYKEPKKQQKKRYTQPPRNLNAAQGLAPGMPVVGFIGINYGQTDDIGAKSQGWTIKTKGDAIVSSPFEGTVKYTGAFKRYGQIILVEHSGGYYSLLGGVSEIYVLPETKVNKGSALGKMGSADNAQNEMNLYYEVRYKGKAVDPKRLLSSRNL